MGFKDPEPTKDAQMGKWNGTQTGHCLFIKELNMSQDAFFKPGNVWSPCWLQKARQSKKKAAVEICLLGRSEVWISLLGVPLTPLLRSPAPLAVGMKWAEMDERK